MTAQSLLQETETPSAIRPMSVDYDLNRPEIIRHMVSAKKRRLNGNTSQDSQEGWDTISQIYVSSEDTLELPEFKPKPAVLQPSFVALQEWEGYVVDIQKDFFTARLLDRTFDAEVETELADFPLSDVSDGDLDLLKPGAIFRWAIGYIRNRGTKIRASQIVFRRLPQWREQDLADAQEQANALAASIPWK